MAKGFRPATDWAGATISGLLTAGVGGADADQYNLSTLMGVDPESQVPQTLRRTRGHWHGYPVAWPGGPAPGIVELACGLCVAPDGATLQSLITDSGWDGWLWREWTYWRLPGGFINPTAPAGTMATNFIGGEGAPGYMDSRAMRKLEDNALVLVVEMATDTGAAVEVNYSLDFRCLFSVTGK